MTRSITEEEMAAFADYMRNAEAAGTVHRTLEDFPEEYRPIVAATVQAQAAAQEGGLEQQVNEPENPAPQLTPEEEQQYQLQQDFNQYVADRNGQINLSELPEEYRQFIRPENLRPVQEPNPAGQSGLEQTVNGSTPAEQPKEEPKEKEYGLHEPGVAAYFAGAAFLFGLAAL